MKPTQEQVLVWAREAGGDDWGLFRDFMPEIERLATLAYEAGFGKPQREWQGLTDEEIREFEIWLDDKEEKRGWNPPADIVKYIEDKLREKNS